MNVSVIVPVLNEALLIQSFLEDVRERTPGAEIVVVDGGFYRRHSRVGWSLRDSEFGPVVDAPHR